uniref:Reverse transcriptase n=1 Tax=Ananas comosus var. bracteatus TaxID=296719 RepID=A0A6V7P9J7_ANACO|nr:unnamed protein product [Ananas comosus var. bracteatus]
MSQPATTRLFGRGPGAADIAEWTGFPLYYGQSLPCTFKASQSIQFTKGFVDSSRSPESNEPSLVAIRRSYAENELKYEQSTADFSKTATNRVEMVILAQNPEKTPNHPPRQRQTSARRQEHYKFVECNRGAVSFQDVMRRGRPPPMVPTPDPAPPLEVPESSVSGEIQDLRDQVAALVGVVRRQAEASQQLAEASQRQEEQMALLRELVSRQAAATPVTQQPPVSPVRAPTGVEAAGAAAPPPMGTPCHQQDKVHLAVHCLEKSARVWWKATRQNRSPTLPPMMWEEFRGLLYGVHFPDSDKKKMEEQFRILKQGDRTVRDYEREFSHIVNCVPHVVRSDEDKAGCFERGLRREIYAAMQPLRLKTFTEVFDRALWVEQGIAKMRAERESNDKGADKKRSASGPAGSSKYKKPPKYPRKPGKDRGPPHCYICGGNHRSHDCERRGKCYQCGQPGHGWRECPMRVSPALTSASAPPAPRQFTGHPPAMSTGRTMVPRQAEGSRAAPSGRVYAAQVEEPAVADDVVAGIILVHNTRARALFDTGASNSFISKSFAKAHDIEISLCADFWWVDAPEHTFSIKDECRACPVQIGDWIMPVNLLVLNRMKGFDIVLGIDWLSKYHATIDCKSKVITFCEPGQKEVVYRACKSSLFAMTVSTSRARRLIKSGCEAYLASVVETQKELPALGDIPVRRWLELLKDYDITILYHPGKANVVADALSRKSFNLEVVAPNVPIVIASLVVRPTLLEKVKTQQLQDSYLQKVRGDVEGGHANDFNVGSDGTIRFRGRLCVPSDEGMRSEIMQEAHQSPYSIHPGGTKMYKDLRNHYWWPGMKKDIGRFVAQCLVCQQVKAEHRLPAGTLQSLPIPVWKWEDVTMDLVVGLPRSQGGHDAIWVVVDRLTKSAHFMPIHTTWSGDKLAQVYLDEVVRLHGVPVSIVSDRDPRFTSQFWKNLQSALGTRLEFSTAFHPQSDGQSERTIQILEDMLRACVLDFKGGWHSYLPMVEFAYNNSYQASIGMALFEALYGRKCRSPIHWSEVGERLEMGPDVVQEAEEKVRIARQRMLTAQSRQKSYADKRRRSLEFAVGDKVFLKVSPMRGVKRFGMRGKLSPRYVGPYEILDRVGPVAYRLALPPRLAGVHNVFHVSTLRKYVSNPTHVLQYEPPELQEDMSYEEFPVRILAHKERKLRNRAIAYVKVQWSNHAEREATWELESKMHEEYPYLFPESN